MEEPAAGQERAGRGRGSWSIDDFPEVMTLDEVATVLRMKADHLRKLIREGGVGFPVRKQARTSRRYYVLREELRAYLTSQETVVRPGEFAEVDDEQDE